MNVIYAVYLGVVSKKMLQILSTKCVLKIDWVIAARGHMMCILHMILTVANLQPLKSLIA